MGPYLKKLPAIAMAGLSVCLILVAWERGAEPLAAAHLAAAAPFQVAVR